MDECPWSLPNVQDEPRPWLARAVLLGARIVTTMVVGSSALLGAWGVSDSVIIVEAIARDRLASATWTWLQVTTDQVQLPAWDAPIIALHVIEVVSAFAISNAIVVLPTDRKPHGLDLRLLVAMPARLWFTPRHVLCLTFKMSHDRGWREPCCSEHGS